MPSNVRINITLRDKIQKRRITLWSSQTGTKPSTIVQHLFDLVTSQDASNEDTTRTLRALGFPI
jgi:hypothetical protein